MLLLDKEDRDLEPFETGSSFSIGWMMSSTFAYRFRVVIDKASSLFFAESVRVVAEFPDNFPGPDS